MKEDFLHYIWLYKKLDFTNLKTTNGETITILNFGQYIQQAGPDFFNAQLIINNQKWAGNIEIHVKSSDWYVHKHENDSNYDNVILHVVWEHDTEVYRKDNSVIPVLEIKNYVSKSEFDKYKKLCQSKSWIYCENEISDCDKLVFSNWKERLFFERIERKIVPIENLLLENKHDWESTFFITLAKNFGLNVNGISFFEMAKSIPFTIIKKELFDVENVEALFFGSLHMLEDEKQDNYYKNLQRRWDFLKQKHQLSCNHINPIQFFKLRPDNFPTIQLAQLATLYHLKEALFLDVIKAKSLQEIYSIFNNATSNYWKSHYNFEKESKNKTKSLSVSFIDLLIINTVVPIKFYYAKVNGKDNSEELIHLMSQIRPEKNIIIDKFNFFKVESKSAFDTQSLLQLKNEYCSHQRCLQCAVGLGLLKK